MSAISKRPIPRAEKARANRRRMREAALLLFRQHGYAATSMQAIADETGLAVQTLYFTFGTKRALLSEILDIAVAGDEEPIATLDRPAVHAIIAEPDPAEQLRTQAQLAREVWGRLAPVLEVVSGAATADPDIAELWQTNIAQRTTVQERLCDALASKARLRHDTQTAVDIAVALQGPELYQLFVGRRGWSPEKYAEWLADALVSQLLMDARRVIRNSDST
jgi:AcrR family transcriptional regulator